MRFSRGQLKKVKLALKQVNENSEIVETGEDISVSMKEVKNLF